MIVKTATDIEAGEWLVNIGRVFKVTVTLEFTEITVLKENMCISAAFYWYHNNAQLIVDNSKKGTPPTNEQQ